MRQKIGKIGKESLSRLFLVIQLGVVLACADPGAPSIDISPSTTATDQLTSSSTVATSSEGLPDWVINPSTLPEGRVGKNNCTFSFGQNVPQWDFHSDAGCWEYKGPDGWTRQQFQRIHIPNFPSCGGGPGDATAIRVCRDGGAGQSSPCLDAATGPNGCARCVISPTCH